MGSPIGQPFGIYWGTDTGERVGDSEVRYFRSFDRLYRMYVTGPDGAEPVREVWHFGRHVAFENRSEMEVAAKRIAKAGGYLLEPCPFCGTHTGAHLNDYQDTGVFVQCDTCTSGGPSVSYETPGCRQRAADLWNARSLPQVEQAIDVKSSVDSSNKERIGVFRLESDGQISLVWEVEK